MAEVDRPGARETRGDLHPRLATARIQLQPVSVSDYDRLRQIELSENLGALWRCGGSTPSPEAWAHGLSAGVLAQFLVVRANDQVPVGIVACYKADFQHQFAYLAAAKFVRADRTTHLMEATVLFIEYLFSCWAFRKLYLEVNGYNLEQFSSGVGRLLEEEGRLSEHVYFGGRYWDQHLLSLWRDRWEESALPRLIKTGGTFSS